MEMKEILNKLVAGRNLTLEETKEAAEIILGGNATDVQTACFLTALRMKGETVDEIVGCASVLGEKAMKIHPKEATPSIFRPHLRSLLRLPDFL